MRIVLLTASALVAVVLLSRACTDEGTREALVTPEELIDGEPVTVEGTTRGSLYGSFQRIDPERGAVLSAVFARLFFWDLDINDLADGDRFAFVYTWEGEWPEIPVAVYESGQLGRTLHAYRYTPLDEPYPSWWDAAGQEVPRRLERSPVEDYEQITSLLKDRPTHRGMDFKAPEGVPVRSPYAGAVTRTNWNVAFNGSVVEVRYDDGTLAKFLHLSEVAVAPGQRVAAGERIGAVGDTGRSTAPHLHYELEKGGRTVDPVDYHGTWRRQLSGDDLPRFEAHRDALDALLAREWTAHVGARW